MSENILPAGTFRVGDYRKDMPSWVKLQAYINYLATGGDLLTIDGKPADARLLQFDHFPALQDRDLDLETSDFIPPQNDPNYIRPMLKLAHRQKTSGRKPDAEKTVTTLGSDQGNAKRNRRVRDTQKLHKARMAVKYGDPDAQRFLIGVRKSRLKSKRKIPNRGFPKRHRPLRRLAAR